MEDTGCPQDGGSLPRGPTYEYRPGYSSLSPEPWEGEDEDWVDHKWLIMPS